MSMAELVPGGVPWTEEDDHGNPDHDLSMSDAQLARYHAWSNANVVPTGGPNNARHVTFTTADGRVFEGMACGNQDDDEA